MKAISLLRRCSLFAVLTTILPAQILQVTGVPQTYTVSTLPAAASSNGLLAWVKDGTSATDCTTGGGSFAVPCKSNGSVWAGISVGSAGGGMADPGANGLVARTATNTTASRTLQGTTNSAFTWTNGDGVAGNPTPALIFPSRVMFRTAVCQAGTPFAVVSLASTSAPAASCATGTNTNYGVLTFSATGQTLQDHFKLPPDFTGAIDVDFVYRSTGTTGNVVWNIATAFTADGATGDPTFNTAQTVSTAAQGTTLLWKTASLTGITKTGAAANSEFYFMVGLDATTTTAGNIDLIEIRFTIRRTL